MDGGPVLSILGSVERHFNITYGEFTRLPIVTVEATCICVGPPAFEVGTHEWKGVQVSALLELADLKPEAVNVVFIAEDSYVSSLPMEKALSPSTIVAFEADGVPLTRETGYPFRLVVPCWWGYKWVKFVRIIEVVDYDHKGVWENRGYPDHAEIPECVDVGVKEYVEGPRPASTNLASFGLIILGIGVCLAIILGRR
ncbi:MAG: molybdopterin-dependent oxidoreductase [Candidatus Bathyarchaeota archaeon]|nr:molybdopterin-dependent oxidoreductase [Candidatus Bathyarchaeota archaeon]